MLRHLSLLSFLFSLLITACDTEPELPTTLEGRWSTEFAFDIDTTYNYPGGLRTDRYFGTAHMAVDLTSDPSGYYDGSVAFEEMSMTIRVRTDLGTGETTVDTTRLENWRGEGEIIARYTPPKVTFHDLVSFPYYIGHFYNAMEFELVGEHEAQTRTHHPYCYRWCAYGEDVEMVFRRQP